MQNVMSYFLNLSILAEGKLFKCFELEMFVKIILYICFKGCCYETKQNKTFNWILVFSYKKYNYREFLFRFIPSVSFFVKLHWLPSESYRFWLMIQLCSKVVTYSSKFDNVNHQVTNTTTSINYHINSSAVYAN